MSSKSCHRVRINCDHIDVFTFGKKCFYGYDSINHNLRRYYLINSNEIQEDNLHLSSAPSWPIGKLILNEDETILALIADSVGYLVSLPQLNQESHLCSINRIPNLDGSSSTSITSSIIDFLWLNSKHFVMVQSIPSSSECHLYRIGSSKDGRMKYIRSYSVGYSSTNLKNGSTPNKKISLHQPSNIIQLNQTKQKNEIILLFAMKSDGDIYILQIHSNDLSSNEDLHGEFQGPIRILPSTFDNYGIDHGQSTFISLKNNPIPLLVFTRDRCQLNQCVVLSSSMNEFNFFTIDTISFAKNSSSDHFIERIIEDRFSSNRYFILDSKGNIYSIEIPWIDQIEKGLKQLQSTHCEHLIHGYNSNQIKQFSLMENDRNEQYFAVINQRKELFLLHCQSNEKSSSNQSEFVDRIRLLLSRNQSIPYLSLSTTTTNISQSDFEKNLLQYLQIFSNEYIQKQEKVKKELENKRNYLLNLSQTQFDEYQTIKQKFENIRNLFQQIKQKYQQELSRQERSSAQLNDLLSVIEQNTPVLSDEEIHMREQLNKYQIQFDCLKESFQRAQQFLSFNQNEQQIDHIQDHLSNYRQQIQQMKKRLQTIENDH